MILGCANSGVLGTFVSKFNGLSLNDSEDEVVIYEETFETLIELSVGDV